MIYPPREIFVLGETEVSPFVEPTEKVVGPELDFLPSPDPMFKSDEVSILADDGFHGVPLSSYRPEGRMNLGRGELTPPVGHDSSEVQGPGGVGQRGQPCPIYHFLDDWAEFPYRRSAQYMRAPKSNFLSVP